MISSLSARGALLAHSAFGILATAGACALASPAAAQDAAPAAAPVAADATPSDRIGEIVVTAQFRAQRLQETPLAITALGADELRARGQTNVNEIANEAPNVTLKPAGAARGPALQAFIRGIGQLDFNPAVSPGVGMYVDDVYFGTITGTNFELLDLDRVEVLRGPQGTLSGQNSIGGSIKLYSKKPDGNGGGYLTATYGSYNLLQLRGSADFTIVPDQLFVRIAGVADRQDGFVKRYDYRCTHPGTTVPSFQTDDGCKLGTQGGQSTQAARLAVRWTPDSKLDVNLIGDITRDQSEATPATLLYVGTTAGPGAVQGPNPKYQIGGVSLGTAAGSPFISHSPFGAYALDTYSSSPYVNYATYCDVAPVDGVSAFCVPGQSRVDSYGVSGAIDYTLSDDLALKSITSHRRQVAYFSFDSDATPVGNANNANRVTHSQTSQELRLTGDVLDRRVNYTVGGFYFDEFTHYGGRQDLPQFDFIENDDVPAKTYAGFANVDWTVVEGLQLSGGARYTKQTKTFEFGRVGLPGNNYNPVCKQPDGSTKVQNPAVPPQVCALDGTSGSFSAGHWDYRAAVQYRWSPEIMTYASVSTGFKGGGVNPRPASFYQEVAFDPETLTAYEVGAKTDLFDRRAQLNAALFYSNYHALQLTVTQCPMNPDYPDVPYDSYRTPCAALLNGGNAVLKGAELEGRLRPARGVSIDGSVSYLSFHFKSLTTGALGSGLTLSSRIPLAPKWKYNVGAQYQAELGGLGTLTPRLDLSYQSSLYTGAPNNIFNRVPGYTLLDGSLTYRSAGNQWELALVVSNITDKLYYYSISDGRSSTATVTGRPAPPREFKLSLRRSF